MDITVATVREGDNTACVASWDTLGSYCWVNFVGKVCSYMWACMNLFTKWLYHLSVYAEGTLDKSWSEVHRISKIVKSHLKILRTRMVKWSRLRTEYPESLGATCCFVHAGPNWVYVKKKGSRMLENQLFRFVGCGPTFCIRQLVTLQCCMHGGRRNLNALVAVLFPREFWGLWRSNSCLQGGRGIVRVEWISGAGGVAGNRKVAREMEGVVKGDIEQEGRIGVVGKGLDRSGVRWVPMW